jgi:hypothetical protein
MAGYSLSRELIALNAEFKAYKFPLKVEKKFLEPYKKVFFKI